MTADNQKRLIIDTAASLGFDPVRVSPAEIPSKYAEAFRKWVAENHHGDMEYLSRRAREKRSISDILPGVRSVITLGVNYFQEDTAVRRPDQGWVSRYAVTRDYHKIIQKNLKNLCRFITETLAAKARYYVDTGPILERAFAETSGLGYIGKNTCLITEDFGSWVFLAEILTTLDLPADRNTLKINCGTCRQCLDQCPTTAICDNHTIDSRRCISYLTIENRSSIPTHLRDGVGAWVFGCDICQDVCPHNRRAIPAALTDFKEIRIRFFYFWMTFSVFLKVVQCGLFSFFSPEIHPLVFSQMPTK